jgi:hypothetical protein
VRALKGSRTDGTDENLIFAEYTAAGSGAAAAAAFGWTAVAAGAAPAKSVAQQIQKNTDGTENRKAAKKDGRMATNERQRGALPHSETHSGQRRKNGECEYRMNRHSAAAAARARRAERTAIC